MKEWFYVKVKDQNDVEYHALRRGIQCMRTRENQRELDYIPELLQCATKLE